MKNILKFSFVLIAITLCSFGLKAQPEFTVNWESDCDYQTTSAKYIVTWALVYMPTSTVVANGTSPELNYQAISYTVTIYNWDCDKDDYPLNYRAVAQVQRFEGTTLTCTGQRLSGAKRCSELYDGFSFTVQMSAP